MSRKPNAEGFRDVESKLNAPTKKSIFERQKAEAEAKRLKEQRETAAVYQDFIKSFDDEGSDDDALTRLRPEPPRGQTAVGGSVSRRHFTTTQSAPFKPSRVSGPGTLGPINPPPSRKRTHEGSPPNHGMRAFGNEDPAQITRDAFRASDDEEEKFQSRAEERAAHRPTIHMSSLPPGMSPAAIKAILPPNTIIENVRVLPISSSGSAERRAMSAIVTLASETPASDLDSMVNSLQNKYLERGYYLSLSRHLSSAVLEAVVPSTSQPNLPFGAKSSIPAAGVGFPPMQARGGRAGFAPPPSLGHAGSNLLNRGGPAVRVAVVPPSDLKQLKLIHKMIESILLHGPEFEALVMSRPEVQKEERWAWLWDPSSVGGIWYRWKLWNTLIDGNRKRGIDQGREPMPPQQIFDRSAPWVAEEPDLPFEFAISLEEFVSDPDYDSSEDEDSGDEGRRRLQNFHGSSELHGGSSAVKDMEGPSYLNPLRKAKLTHLISRVPGSNARLRKGDIARVTAFAIQNAGQGAEEVVELLVANVLQPFSLIGRDRNAFSEPRSDEEVTTIDGKNATSEETDPSSAKLVALYLISDILSSSSTSGVRHAWRYRQLFETALRRRRVFWHLGRLERELKWGKLKAEKWRRAVNAMFSLWEGWSVFTTVGQEDFVETFKNPALTAEEKLAVERAENQAKAAERATSRWKAVKETANKASASLNSAPPDDMEVDDDLDGDHMEDGTDEDLDGIPMEDDDDDDDDDGNYEAKSDHTGDAGQANELEAKAADVRADVSKTSKSTRASGQSPSGVEASGRKSRPRAVDMFGDSDDEKEN